MNLFKHRSSDKVGTPMHLKGNNWELRQFFFLPGFSVAVVSTLNAKTALAPRMYQLSMGYLKLHGNNYLQNSQDTLLKLKDAYLISGSITYTG